MKRQKVLLTAGYNNFGKGLSRYATSRTHNRALTDDLVQNTFLKTWKYLVKGGKIDTMEAFLYHVLKALIIDEYRKRKTTSLDSLMEKGFDPSLDETYRQADKLDGKQATDLIARLPVLYRKVMRLRYVQDLSLQEIALITGQSRNTVAVQAHRGLEKLRALYVERAASASKNQSIKAIYPRS
jgi:RNA polymerase sigma-70 factor (ECF subfamily)